MVLDIGFAFYVYRGYPVSLEVTQSLRTGQQVGNYRVEFLLGSGGMADVYYAMDLQLDRPVALKVLAETSL